MVQSKLSGDDDNDAVDGFELWEITIFDLGGNISISSLIIKYCHHFATPVNVSQ